MAERPPSKAVSAPVLMLEAKIEVTMRKNISKLET
jgi:hypothetical protein